jgi:hypothetical protein
MFFSVKSDGNSTIEDNLFTTPISETYLELSLCCPYCRARLSKIQRNIILALLQFCDKIFMQFSSLSLRLKVFHLTTLIFNLANKANLLHSLFFFVFFYWRFNPLWVLAFSAIFFYSALSSHCFFHSLTPIICKSSSMPAILPYLCPYCIVQFVSMRAVRLMSMSSSQQFSFPGQSRQPCAQPPTWKTRVSLLVWSLN